MKYLGTYRAVPAVSSKAMARAVVVFAAYLAAVDHGLPFAVAPLSFALALELLIRAIGNLLREFPGPQGLNCVCTVAGWSLGALVVGLVILGLVNAGADIAHRYWVGWMLGYAGIVMIMSLLGDGAARQFWFRDDPDAALALLFHAGGVILTALTGLGLARFDPLAFIALVTFGSKLMLFLSDWVIVLMLYPRRRDREGA